jgi:hypothetical protein
MKKNKHKKYVINYTEGDCFIFPLRDGGFARGIVVRMDTLGGILGYFYGPILQTSEEAKITNDLIPANAIYVHFCGDLGLVDDKYAWHVIGKIPDWSRKNWSMPIFGSVDLLRPSRGEIRIYDEDTLQLLRIKVVTASEAKQYPEDGVGGCGFIEKQVSKILHRLE